MATRAAVLKEYEDNFVLDEAKLRKIASIVAEYAAKLGPKYFVEFYVEREDQTSYETKSVDEVLADENAEGKRIVTVSMSIEPPDDEDDAAQKIKRKKLKRL